MNDSSSLWSHILDLRPQLRGHIRLYPQIYRGEKWYVLHDESSSKYLRFNEQAYTVLQYFDGDLTLQEIHEIANSDNSKHSISQEDFSTLFGQLSASEVLQNGLPVNIQNVYKQYQSQKRKKKQSLLLNPLSIKIPLFNPDTLLKSMIPFGKILFSKLGFLLWATSIFIAFLLTIVHHNTLFNDISKIEISPLQIVAIWIIYPFIKVFHEFAHGLAVRTWGGAVSEMGVNFLLFMPIPYVDATASWGFRNKWRRVIVGAAGILVELFLASLALFLYLLVEPGFVQQATLNVMVIATLSTLLFNGNPLLRFDGYFILEDYLEIPNLATRAKRYYYYLIQKYLLKIDNVFTSATAFGEEKWFLIYGFLAPLYRLVILFSITLYLLDSFLVVGIILALLMLFIQVLTPIAKGVLFLITNEIVAPKRLRAYGLLFSILLFTVAILSIPIPNTSYVHGVVWSNQGTQVTAKHSGFVLKSNIDSGSFVEEGVELLQLQNNETISKEKELRAKLRELQATLISQHSKSRIKSDMVKDDINALQKELKHTQKELKSLNIFTQTKGKFVTADHRILKGQFIHKGDIIGHIINPKKLIIKIAIPQSRIGLLQKYDTSVSYSLENDLSKVYKSKIIRKTPQATNILPSAVLTTAGGGIIGADSTDKSGRKALSPFFLLDIKLDENLDFYHIGSRAYVKLEHTNLAIGKQLWLGFNQLFLRHFYGK